MIKSIRHLRAGENEWESNDIVIPDGEIAIVKTKGGNNNLKIGNGIDRFSNLPSLLGCTVKPEKTSIIVMHAKTYRFGEIPELAISFPDTIDDDFYAEISFDSGIDATEFSTEQFIRFSGDGVADEEFMPKSHMHYTLCIWYDGSLQGVVRGLPNA